MVEVAGYGEVQPMGAGAASDLYRAKLDASDRWVAIKIFRFALADDAAQRRFLRDGELAKSLSTHPHVATVYDAGVTGDRRPYLTMELVDSGSVADRLTLTSHGLFTPAEIVRIGAAVAAGLEAAHDAGAVHRFLQPTGILLTSEGRPLVTELGVTLFAERWEAAGYLEDAVPYHASPEALEREVPGPASDVYSLASTLYAMLAGSPPHRAGNVDSVSTLLLHVLQHEPPSLVSRGVPASLDAVLRAGLAAELGQRTPTATAFREQLEQIRDELGEGPPEEPEDREPREPPDPALPPLPVSTAPASTAPSVEEWDGDADRDPAVPAVSRSVALERMAQAMDDTDDSRRWRRRAWIVAGAGLTILLALAAEGLRSSDSGSESAEQQTVEDPAQTNAGQSTPEEQNPSAGTGTISEPPTNDVNAPDQLLVPTGLDVHASEAGVQLDWDETDTDSFAVLVLSETAPPRIETTMDGPSLFIPVLDLRTDDGYCFAVARLDMVANATDEGAPGDVGGSDGEEDGLASEIGPAFSPVVCIRGAAEDTIRTE